MSDDGAPTQADDRGQFGSRIGFVLAAIGSAVGFGSIARFPMNTANNGGAAFVLVYAAIMVLIGIPLMIAEFSVGRTAQTNSVGAFKKLEGDDRTRWKWLGVLYFLVAAFFLSWYSIVSGWTLRYVFDTMTGSYFGGDAPAHLGSVVEGPWTLFWHAVVMLLVLAAVNGKISKGIERVNLIMMPMLFAIVLGLAIYAATLPNVGPGYEFYLTPDFSKITMGVITAAVGQAFFSLSLGIGAMMIYASYLSKQTSLASNAAMVSLSTLGFAVMAGFMVFPLLSSFNLLSGDVAGLDLIFGPLPAAFAQMGTPTGQIVGTLFFVAAFFAAFTSAVALTEPAIAYVTEEWNIHRKKAAVLVCTLIYIAGIAVAFSTDLLGFEGGALTDLLVIAGGLGMALYVGWRTSKTDAIARMDESDAGLRVGRFVYPIVRWVMPVVLVVLLFFNLFGTPCFLGGAPGAEGGFIGDVFGQELLQCRAPAAQLAP